MNFRPVPLERKFSQVSSEVESPSETDYASLFGTGKAITWKELESESRVVILADAGAGKTVEMDAQARKMSDQGKYAFFIRIEDIDRDFVQAFEVGDEEQFEQWLSSTEPAWFFLDSVDEALLIAPKSFEKAIRLFSRRIKSAVHRAHIYISSRPYAWRFSADRQLIDDLLPSAAPRDSHDKQNHNESAETGLKLYALKPLDKLDILYFATCRDVPNIELLITEIERKSLMAMASRPFDLDGILVKWKTDQQLGSRLELMQFTIETKLKEIDPNRARIQSLSQEKIRDGARLLAAAVTLSGNSGIRVPDSTHEQIGIDAAKLLKDWTPIEIQVLLEKAIFNDIIYGAVRFRHREIRELLTAEWFHSLLENGHSRRTIESLFFQEKYGQTVITPRLRPILPWLILFDSKVRERALELSPEIAVEGGDISQLPIELRKKILVDIVSQIAAGDDSRGARDNNAIARIALSDLSDITLHLIKQYKENDEAIFFLGRLVWQGNMANCLDELFPIALNGYRDVYARVASTRAIFTVGNSELKVTLWRELLEAPEQLALEILSEMIDEAPSNLLSIELLLKSLSKLPPYDRFQNSLIRRRISRFIDCVAASPDSVSLLARLIDGIYDYLQLEPFLEWGEFRVSKEFIWLVVPALHAIEKLIICRAPACFNHSVLEILLNQPSVKFWHASELPEYVGAIKELVPQWPALNDELFWRAIESEREKQSAENKHVVDCWPVLCVDPLFKFDADSFERVVAFIKNKGLFDDRLVAITLAARLYHSLDKPSAWLPKLQAAVEEEQALITELQSHLYPKPSESQLKYEEQRRQFELSQVVRARRKDHQRKLWIARLRNNPEAVRQPKNLASDEISNDQSWLLEELRYGVERDSIVPTKDWQSLVNDFGTEVAGAFRDSVMAFWRNFQPEVGSEGGDISTYPHALIFAMTGIEVEANEAPGFPDNLSSEEVAHALRFITWEINGFPSWFEKVFRAFPEQVCTTVWHELKWELDTAESDQSKHYILHDLVYYAPWIHNALGQPLLSYLNTAVLANIQCLRYCIRILINADLPQKDFLALAKKNATTYAPSKTQPLWYALWVSLDPESGTHAVKAWLQSKSNEDATVDAQWFAAALMGSRSSDSLFEHSKARWNATHLKSLYVLMYQQIRVEDDINRVGKGVYSPELRDDAQDARDALFKKLTEFSGKETYIALCELAEQHPVVSYRSWMSQCAKSHVIRESDIQPWNEEDVYLLKTQQVLTPSSHEQLYKIGLLHLEELKHWLESGNDSSAPTFRRVTNENEMRAILARELRVICKKTYIVSEEQPLANAQRPDIWLQHQNVSSPVPIELKILDKKWSGPKLCERLRNQLVGDYLRETTAGCGIFLLVWQGEEDKKRWKVDGNIVGLERLSVALKQYWLSISMQFPNVSNIEVVVIDLTKRADVSAD
ncbi:hypothetical protein ABC502_13800 [Alkalimonas sp. NCh-2]|uniref:NACHT domain-containing protein n=1 Tax=Alkalimonas sp. NCh-2 TaxID=3144846 RepID=UPI0031F706FA